MKRKNELALRIVKYAEIFVLALALSVFSSVNTEQHNGYTDNQPITYRLSVYNGRVAVFENADDKPVEVFDVYISSLPYTEQVELSNGITVSTKAELQTLIEDYTS